MSAIGSGEMAGILPQEQEDERQTLTNHRYPESKSNLSMDTPGKII